VSRLYAHSKNYDMDLTLDYNVELFPLQKDQNFALALASSLARGGRSAGAADGAGEDTNDSERDVWRPDGKGSRGLEDEYDYVMYGKVCPAVDPPSVHLFSRASKIYKFDGESGEIV
jgi:DNA-directed RNA polymerase I, II, and III subunit RPABC3